MKEKIKGLIVSLLVFFCFSMLTGQVVHAAESIEKYPGVAVLDHRGSDAMEAKFGYTPKFIVDSTKVTETVGEGTSVKREMIADQFFIGEGAVFTAPKGTKNSGKVLYENMGTYNGQNVNIELSFTSDSPKVLVGTDKDTFLMTFGYSSVSSGEKINVSLKFLDDKGKPLEVNGNWTFSAVNNYKHLRFDKNFFDKAYVLKGTKITYEVKDQLIDLIGLPGGSTNGDHTYMTLAFSNKAKFDYSYECVSALTYAVRFDPNSLATIQDFPLLVKGEKIQGQNREKEMPVFTYTQQVPNTNEIDYLSKYQFETQLDSKLVVNPEKIEIKDNLNQNRRNDFDVMIGSDNKLKITAKSSSLSKANFYDMIYQFKIPGKVSTALDQEISLKSSGKLSVERRGYTLNYDSNEATSTFYPSTKGYLSYKIARKDNNLSLRDVKIKPLYNKNEYRMLEFELPKHLKVELSKVGKEAENPNYKSWFVFKNEMQSDHQLVSISLDGKTDIAVIEGFLKEVKLKIDESEKLTTTKMKINLKTDVYTSRYDKEKVRHYYKFAPGQKSWLEAYNDAKQQTFKGLTGYLATLTSEEEHLFVYQNIGKDSGWLGGTRLYKSPNRSWINDEATISQKIGDYIVDNNNSKWYWASGPEAKENHHDKVFFNQPKRNPANMEQGVVPGVYESFDRKNTNDPEPNNSLSFSGGQGEYCLEFARGSFSEKWNDLTYNEKQSGYVKGYYVEFSEYDNQHETESDNSMIVVEQEEFVPQLIEMKYESETGKKLKNSQYYAEEIKIGDVLTLPTAETVKYYQFDKLSNSKVTIFENKQAVTYVYKPVEYTLAYHANKGTGTIPAQKFTIETPKITISDNENGFKRTNFKLLKWNTAMTGKGTEVAFKQEFTGSEFLDLVGKVDKETVTLYAIWGLDTKDHIKFDVERNGDDVKLVNPTLAPTASGQYEMMRIELPEKMAFPENMVLPSGWYKLSLSEKDRPEDMNFAIASKRDATTIQNFLKSLTFDAKKQPNEMDSGQIKIKFYKKIYTSMEIPNPSEKEKPGTKHYYRFYPGRQT